MIKELSDGSIKFVGNFDRSVLWAMFGCLIFLGIAIFMLHEEGISSYQGFVGLCGIAFFSYALFPIFGSGFHQFTLSPTTILIRSQTERIIKLQEISSAKLFQDEELIFYDENGDEDDCMDLSFFKQDDVQVFLNMLAKKGIFIDVAEEMKERGFIVPKNRHSKLSQQSQYYTKDTDEYTETTPRQRRRVVKTDNLDIDDADTSRPKTHKRWLEF